MKSPWLPTLVPATTALGAGPVPLALIARRTIDWLIAPWLEGYLGLLTTLSTDGREHLLLPAVVATAAIVPTISVTLSAEVSAPRFLAGIAAIGATAWLIGEALTGEKVLLAGGEGEVSPTVTAG